MGGMATTPDIAATTPRLGRYEIDAGLAPVRGSFAIRGGTVDIAEPLAASVVHAQIESVSFRTGNGQRDAAVRSPRVLDAEHHPFITFDSERPGTRDIPGTLTVRGVTRAVRLRVTDVTVAPGSFTVRATARIDRTEFGVTAYRGLAGRYLDMSVEAQCIPAS
jgi:polyisoprenoid-binding protein YceI